MSAENCPGLHSELHKMRPGSSHSSAPWRPSPRQGHHPLRLERCRGSRLAAVLLLLLPGGHSPHSGHGSFAKLERWVALLKIRDSSAPQTSAPATRPWHAPQPRASRPFSPGLPPPSPSPGFHEADSLTTFGHVLNEKRDGSL